MRLEILMITLGVGLIAWTGIFVGGMFSKFLGGVVLMYVPSMLNRMNKGD